MTLTSDGLNDLDTKILEILADGRATPTLVRKMMANEGDEFSRQYVNQRLKRLEEHEHVRNVLDTGVYELMDDPRDER